VPSEQELSGVLSEFARTMLTDFPIQAILDHLVTRIVDVLPISAAGVTLIAPGADPRYVAASDGFALRFEELQTELGEGPCVTAYQTGEAVAVVDLRTETRFQRFVPRALGAGLVAMFTFPLRSGPQQLGALDLYCDTPGPMDARTMEAAQTLADVAAAYLLNAQARADLRAASALSQQRSLHDPLTGLPNRTLLLERLEHAVRRGGRTGKVNAVLFVDLDHFKGVNDLYGHSVGDELLVAVAQRVGGVLRPGDSLARLSGDEFVILCEDLDGSDEVDAIATRVGAEVAAPFALSVGDVEITASVGIASSARDDQLSERLLLDADTAMYQAKRKGGARHQILDLERDLSTSGATLARDLHDAVARGELRTQYRPIVETVEGRLFGVETLLRWAHSSHGLLPSTLVVPLAEESGLITKVGGWILEQTCRDGQRWQRHDRDASLMLSVGVSAKQLMTPRFAHTLATLLADTDTDGQRLTLEVTEGVLIHDSERALLVLNALKELGVGIALDDFGAGYSSLHYLKRFPIDMVKLDQGFVADLDRDAVSRCIVGRVIEVAHLLGMTTVAEGVETAEQHAELEEFGCDYCQGDYFAPAMSADELDALTRQHPAAGAPHPTILAAAGS
jgi:diguanylate cyclase (GGDEF)-like protein